MILLKLLKESLIFAYSSVMVNKLRTLLSLLGITIGIFAIISVFTIVDSLERNIRDSISVLGDDVIYVQKWPWAFNEDYPWWVYMRRPVPDLRDYNEISRRSEFAGGVVFSVSTGSLVRYGSTYLENIGVWANTHEFQDIRYFEIENGRYFTPYESAAGRNLAVIGHEIAIELFDDENPVGKEIQVSGRRVTVIGVAQREGSNMLGGGSLDEMVLIPLNYARSIYNIRSDRLNPMIMVKARPDIPNQMLIDELRHILRSARRLKPSAEDNFALNQASAITQGLDQIFVMINLVGWIIGGFSILVGGFGIANIMFVSVKERTNQIGIQKSLGAKNYFILLQFLYESVLLAVTGGVLGLVLIFTGTLLVSNLSDFTITLTAGNIGLGLFVSAVIGVIAGYAPAYAASRLNPVEAINNTF
ncbi:MAG: ABC transporter permease [Bacteroidales bacterium]